MTATLERPQIALPQDRPSDGGVPARRAVVRWAWRLFRREWRQQLLVLLLIVVAVAAVVIGSAVATNTPLPSTDGFGTAMDQAVIQGPGPHLESQIAAIHQRWGGVDVIENQTLVVPGTINTFELRAQNSHGLYGQPMLQLLTGHFPTTDAQVAVTPGVASEFNLRVGQAWREGGTTREVVGTVQNPQSLLDEFALVLPGTLKAPTQVTVLFDAPGVSQDSLQSSPLQSSLGSTVLLQTPAGIAGANILNPETIVLALATLGMLLIALVSIGGFTVLAQRRIRSIGMLGALGATDRNIGLVVRANGAVVGVVGTVLGLALGLAGWFAYRPHLEQSSHHLFGALALPWGVIGIGCALAVVATYFAASRPAKAITKVPVVTALSGRPAPPKEVHRSAVPGVLIMVIAFFLFGVSGASRGSSGAGTPELLFGFVLLIIGVILLSPMFLTVLSRVGRRTPITIRMALRDLARYRARSGSALAAISLGVLIAVLVCIVAAARYGNVLDYAGPNLTNNQLVVYAPNGFNGNGTGPDIVTPAMQHQVNTIAAALGSHNPAELYLTSAQLDHAGSGRQFNGPLFVATPQLLREFGISPSQVQPNALVLTMRPGLAGLSHMQLTYGQSPDSKSSATFVQPSGPQPLGNNNNDNVYPCPRGSCIANPMMQTVNQLPGGTSAPNTLVTEHAVHSLGLQLQPAGWFIQASGPLTAAEITNARAAATTGNFSIETKNDAPSSSEITNWATVFGIALALGVLAMSVGLIRSEARRDLRTLTAAGASAAARRSLTAATAGALALMGALLGTIGAYVAALGWFRSNALNGLSSLASVPWGNLGLIVIGMPLAAVVIGWLIAGRQPSTITLQPME